MKCYQCDKNAMFLVGPDDQQIPLCLDCRLKFVQMLDSQNAMLETQINYLTASMESSMGLPPVLPRFSERKIINTGDITLNNINVDRSVIGVLNTGNIETIDMAVTNLHKTGNNEIGQAILKLSEAIIKETTVSNEIKNQLTELLSVISTEATAPIELRKKSILKPLILEFSTIIGGIAGLSQIWLQVKPIIESLIH